MRAGSRSTEDTNLGEYEVGRVINGDGGLLEAKFARPCISRVGLHEPSKAKRSIRMACILLLRGPKRTGVVQGCWFLHLPRIHDKSRQFGTFAVHLPDEVMRGGLARAVGDHGEGGLLHRRDAGYRGSNQDKARPVARFEERSDGLEQAQGTWCRVRLSQSLQVRPREALQESNVIFGGGSIATCHLPTALMSNRSRSSPA